MLTTGLRDLQQSADFMSSQIEDIKLEVTQLRAETQKMAERTGETRENDEARSLKSRFEDLTQQSDNLENHSRRMNLRFDGIQESGPEDWETTERKVAKFITDTLKLPQPCIERAHQLSKMEVGKSKPRTVIVKFSSFKETDKVLKTARDFRNGKVTVYKDFLHRTQQIRQSLQPRLRDLRQQGYTAYLVHDSKKGARIFYKPKDPSNLRHQSSDTPISAASSASPVHVDGSGHNLSTTETDVTQLKRLSS